MIPDPTTITSLVASFLEARRTRDIPELRRLGAEIALLNANPPLRLSLNQAWSDARRLVPKGYGPRPTRAHDGLPIPNQQPSATPYPRHPQARKGPVPVSHKRRMTAAQYLSHVSVSNAKETSS